MIGQIFFTWSRGSDLDHNCKKWRLFADLLNDLATLIELTAPLWTSGVQLALCLASVGRSLVGVAGGATRTAVTQHQARDNNISDVAAKDGSQETLVNLAALVINLAVLPLLGDDMMLTWIMFLLLTALHVFANFRAVKSLRFRTLNQQRALILLREFLYRFRIARIDDVNREESVWIGFGVTEKDVLCGKSIAFGDSFSSLDVDSRAKAVQELNARGFFVHNKEDRVSVILSEKASKADHVLAYFEAAMIAVEKSPKEAAKLLQGLKMGGWKTDYLQMNSLGWEGKL